MFLDKAKLLTGNGKVTLPLPLGLSGWLKTPTTSCLDWERRSRVGLAKSGVPMKTIFNEYSPSQFLATNLYNISVINFDGAISMYLKTSTLKRLDHFNKVFLIFFALLAFLFAIF